MTSCIRLSKTLTNVSSENTASTFRAEMPRRLRQYILPETPEITHRTTVCHDPKHNSMYNPTRRTYPFVDKSEPTFNSIPILPSNLQESSLNHIISVKQIYTNR